MGIFLERIKNYLDNTNSNQVSVQDIENAIQYFQNIDFTDNSNNTIFDTEEIDRNQFTEALAKVKEVDPSDAELQTNASILFDIYNLDGNDKLNVDELADFNEKRDNSNGIVITNYTVWKSLPTGEYNLEEKLQELYEKEAAEAATVDTTDSPDSTATTTATTTSTTTPTTTPTITKEVPDVINDQKKTPIQADLSESYEIIKNHPELPPETVINDLLANERITPEQADALRLEFTIYYDDDEQAIKDAYDYLNDIKKDPNTTITRADAIEYCKNNNKLSDKGPVATPETYWEIYGPQNKDGLSDSEIESNAETLYAAFEGTGTRNNIIEDFFNNTQISLQDKVKILAKYDELHGSFLKAIQDDYTWITGQNHIEELYVNTLMDAAKEQVEMAEKRNGYSDTSAVTLLCIEFYQGTIAQSGTADHFIKSIMEKGKDYDKVIAAMDTVFTDVLIANKGVDNVTLKQCIREDFSNGPWWSTESDYINRVDTAIKNSQ